MVHVSDIMDRLPFELKLMIINYLPLDTVKAVMMVSCNLWHVCQYWSYWNNIDLKISHRNVKTLIENCTLLQHRFSSNYSVTFTVYTWFISSELIDSLIRIISFNKPKSVKLIGMYHGCWELLKESIKAIGEVDMTSLRPYTYVQK